MQELFIGLGIGIAIGAIIKEHILHKKYKFVIKDSSRSTLNVPEK